MGHISRQCPSGNWRIIVDNGGRRDYRDDHDRRENRDDRDRRSYGSGGSKCYQCGKFGHIARDCSQEEGGA